MKNNRGVSFITALTLAGTMFFNSGINAVAKEIDSDLLTTELKEELKAKGLSELRNLKGYSISEQKINESEKNQYSDEEIRVIIQLDELPAIENTDGDYDYDDNVKDEEEKVKGSQSGLIDKVEEITGQSVIRNFGYLVNGFSITTKRKYINEIRALDGVKSVTEVRAFKPSMHFSNQITGAYKVWKDIGYKGEGMLVSIIDSGIDYTHKDLQDIDKGKIKLTKDKVQEKIKELNYGSYFTDKIPFGYNYADGNDNVIGEVSQHGMHVAGIVAANGDTEGEDSFEAVKGVAPEAQLLAMKVFGNNPDSRSSYDDDIIAAMEDSVKLGADVINMSFGEGPGFSSDEDPESIAVKNATDAGVICVIAAGNEQTSTTNSIGNRPSNLLGMKDTAEVSAPSTAREALSVASSENSTTEAPVMSYKTKEGITKEIPFINSYYSDLSVLSGFCKVVDCGKGKITDTENDFEGKDLNGKLALVEKEGTMYQSQYDNAVDNGAIGVIVYNDEDRPIDLGLIDVYRVAFSIGKNDALEIKDLIKSGDDSFEFSDTGKLTGIANVDENDMSHFSSWGTTPDLEFKPEITAPGGHIYSLQNNNTYGAMSGTSMSAPNTTGSEALLLQAIKEKNISLKGSELVKFAKNTAMNTSKVLIDKYDVTHSVPYSPRRQGAGLIQIENAIKNNVVITYKDGKAAAALKEVGKTTTFDLELKNYGSNTVTYDLSKEKVFSEVVKDNYIKEIELKGSGVAFNKDKVTIEPGSTETVTATLNLSEDMDINNFVEGFINFKSKDSNVPSLSVPFMGFYGDWSEESIIDSPNYIDDNIKTHIGSSGVMSSVDDRSIYLGAVEVEKEENRDKEIKKIKETQIVKEKTAFSPNNDGIQDSIWSMLYFLRNARNIKVQVADSSGNIIRDLDNSPRAHKCSYAEFCYGVLGSSSESWDGTIYNKSTGKYEVAEDGQYSMKITSSMPLEGSREQVLELPVKLDTVAPEVKIDGVKEVNDADGKKHFNLTWIEKDNDNGSGINDIFAIAVNGKIADINYNNVIKENGKYTVDIPFEEGKVNTVQIAAIDNAGNISEVKEKVKSSKLKPLAFDNLLDGMILGKSNIVDGKYTIEGTVANNLKRFIINDKEVFVKDNEFKEAIEVKEGENTIKVYAEDNNGEVIIDNLYKILVDTVPPEFSVTPEGLTEESPYYTTDKESLDLNINLEEDKDVRLFLEGKELEVNNGHAFKSVYLYEGLNTIEISASDKADNITKKKLKIVKTSALDKFKVMFDNILAVNYIKPKETIDGVYSVLGNINKKVKIFKVNGEDINIKDDLSFEYKLKLKNGNNLLKVYAEDDNGNVLINYSYKLYYDEILPTLKINDFIIREDGNIYTNKDLFNVNGKVTDNMLGYELYINGDCLIDLNYEVAADKECLEREFSKDISLSLGLNKINLIVIDSFRNEVNDELNVVLDKEAPNKPKLELSNGGLSNDKVTVKIDSDEKQVDKIEYSFDGVNFVPYSKEFTVDDSSVVYARVIDYAGNISEIASADVTIDKIAPVVTVDGVSDGDIYNESVKPIVKVDDNEAKLTVLLNGEAYNGEAIEKEGEYTLEAFAEDKASNKSEVVTKKFKIEKKQVQPKKNDKVVVESEEKVSNDDNKNEVDNGGSNNGEVNKTGDKSNANIIMFLALSALAIFAVSLRLEIKKREEN